MLKMYGTSRSRSSRSLWALEELGIKYEHIPTAVADARKPDHLKINPNGHIPAIDDDGVIIWESMAINLYLAEKYGKPPLWPASVADHGHAYQWSVWGMTEIEPHLIAILRNRVMAPPEQRDQQAAKTAEDALKAPLKVLDDHLKGREYLLGKDFTIADLNAAGALMFAPLVRLDMSAVPVAKGWLDKCLGRPSLQRARAQK